MKKRIYRRKSSPRRASKNKPVAKIVTKGFWTKKRTAALIVAIFVGLGIVAGITGYYLSREEPVEAAVNIATNDDGNYEATVNGEWLGFRMKGGVKENSRKGDEKIKLTYTAYDRHVIDNPQDGNPRKDFNTRLGNTLKEENWWGAKVAWVSVPAEMLISGSDVDLGWENLFYYIYASRDGNWIQATSGGYDLGVSYDKQSYLKVPKTHSPLSFNRKKGGEFDSDFSVHFEEPGPYISTDLNATKANSIGAIGKGGGLVGKDNSRATFCLRLPLTMKLGEHTGFTFSMKTETFSAMERAIEKIHGKRIPLGGISISQQIERNYRASWAVHNVDDPVENLYVQKMRGGIKSPQELTAKSTLSTSAELRWNRTTGYNAYKYRVQRAEANSTVWREVKVVGGDQGSVKDTGLTKGKSYKYRVGAVNYYDGSKNFVYYWSPEVTVTAGEGGVVAKPKKLPKDDGVVAKPVSTDIPEDVNQDGYVNWLDVSRVLAYNGFPGAKVVTKPTREDVNSDSVVDWLDIGRILAYKGFPQTGAASKTKVAPVDSGSAPATKSKAIKAQ